ncbi:SHOCT domain-containing protein [Haladaptatus sp. DYF46]|uniref:SHOCT domain-containing protein n=1 Tax=Haladaptatus sp. DYF46 TaxID=2886041 RepID=UPI001E4C2694|nr:SHOCT domain-containing protein [Haladaptatus sp. DYF46]
MSELSEILPEDDFWRVVVLGGFAVFFTGVIAIVASEASYLLGIVAVLGFLVWYLRDGGETVVEKEAEETELDAVEVLRARYANGDIDEAEFEGRLDTLLETETAESREKELSFE